MIKSNLKQMVDDKSISIRQLSEEIDHGFETVRKMYNDELKHFPKDLLDKLCNYFECEPGDLIKRVVYQTEHKEE